MKFDIIISTKQMDTIIQWIQQNLFLSPQVQSNLLRSALVILALIVIRRIVLLFVYRGRKDIGVRYHWRKSTSYVAFGLGLIIVGSIWISGFRSITTYLGLVFSGNRNCFTKPFSKPRGLGFYHLAKTIFSGRQNSDRGCSRRCDRSEDLYVFFDGDWKLGRR